MKRKILFLFAGITLVVIMLLNIQLLSKDKSDINVSLSSLFEQALANGEGPTSWECEKINYNSYGMYLMADCNTDKCPYRYCTNWEFQGWCTIR
jgi:hypothetical protein